MYSTSETLEVQEFKKTSNVRARYAQRIILMTSEFFNENLFCWNKEKMKEDTFFETVGI